jgi:ribosomal protein L13
MANSTVAALTSSSALTGTEIFYSDDGSADVKVTSAQIKTYVLATPVSVGANTQLSTTDLKIGNATANIFANSILIQIANSTSTANLQPTQLLIGTTTANTLGVYAGIVNAATHSVGATFTANATLVNAAAINITGQTNTATLYVTTSANVGTAFIANTLGAYSTGIINGASHTVGTSTIANSLGVYTGIVNGASHTVGTSTIANSLGVYTGIVNGASHTVGALFTANATLVNAAALNVTGQTNTATLYVTTSVNVGTQFIANTLGAYSTGIVNGASHTTTGITANVTGIWPTSNSSGQTLGGATQRWVITANSITTSGNITTPNTGLVTATSAVANGYTYLTGGILMQWGWVLANSSVGNITFPVAFPAAMYHISCTMSNTTVSTGNAAYQCIASNSSTANVRSANVGNPGANVMYIAIGS